MIGLLRTLAAVGVAYAAWSVYRQSSIGPQRSKHRLHVETWENEGGALRDVAASQLPTTGMRSQNEP
jgi:hypothetical protein